MKGLPVNVLARILLVSSLCLVWMSPARGQTVTLSERMASTAMNTLYRDAARNESGKPAKWTYDFGVVLKGIEGVWFMTAERKYFEHIRQGLDYFVNAD